MSNIQEREKVNVDASENRAFGWAAIIGANPLPLLLFFVALVTGIILIADAFHRWGVPDYLVTPLEWVKWIFFITVGIVALKILVPLGMSFYGHYHEIRATTLAREAASLKVQKERIQLTRLQVKVDLEKQLPAVMKYGIDSGQNIEYAGLKVTSPFSNVHTMGVDPRQGQAQIEAPAIEKPSVAHLVGLIEPNSFQIAMGVNVATREPIIAELPGNHLIILGRSQMGKSSLVGGIITQANETHDTKHLKLAVLDLEDMTGKLFNDDPHILEFKANGVMHKMHARTPVEVAESVILLYRYMEHRYQKMSEYGVEWADEQPRVLVYFEEFLQWRKTVANLVSKEVCTMAMAAFLSLATRGLKVGMHLMVCAQVNYEDKALKEAMAQLTGIRVSLAVSPPAARGAGFVETALLNAVYSQSIKGQFVVEKAGDGEIGLAANFDARALVKALAPARGRGGWVTVDEMPELAAPALTKKLDAPETTEDGPGEPPAAPDNVRVFPIQGRDTRPVATLLDAKRVWNDAAEEGVKLSRYTLRDRLDKAGLACNENQSRVFLQQIQVELNGLQAATGE